MKPKCAYPNTQSASYAVDRHIRQELDLRRKLTLRPWNHYEPVNTDWWLIPSTDWPAYRYGKFFIHVERYTGRLYCGFYVEKGLDPSAAAALQTSKKLMLKPDWTWHRVVEDMESGALRAPTLEVIQRSGRPLLIAIEGGKTSSDDKQLDYIAFEDDGQGLCLRSFRPETTPLSQLSGCESQPSLARALKNLPQYAWTWINLYLGLELAFSPLEPEAGQGLEAWEAPELWERCLAPWLPWVV